MRAFYGFLQQGKSKAEALREAMLQLRRVIPILINGSVHPDRQSLTRNISFPPIFFELLLVLIPRRHKYRPE